MLIVVGVVLPVWDFFETKRLRNDCTTKARLRHYWSILAFHFVLTAISIWLLGGQVLNAGGALATAMRSTENAALRYSLLGVAILFALVVLSPLITGLVRPK